MDINFDYINPEDLRVEQVELPPIPKPTKNEGSTPFSFGYDVVANFNRKWGTGALNTPERTLSLLFPEIDKALMKYNINSEFVNEEGESPADNARQRSANASTDRKHQDDFTTNTNNNQEVFLPYDDNKFQLAMTSYLDAFGNNHDKEMFKTFLTELQKGKDFTIDPKEVERLIVDSYLKDLGALKIDQDSHLDITNLLTSTIYSSMGQAYDYVHMPNKEKLNIGTKTLVDYGLSSAFNIAELIGGGLATTKVLSGAGKLLASPAVQKLGSSIFSRLMTQNTYLTKGIGISASTAKFIGGVLTFGYYNRLIEPIVDKIESTYKTKKLLDILGVTEKRKLLDEYKAIDFNPSTVLKDDLAIGLELTALGGGLILATKTPKVIYNSIRDSFNKSIKTKHGMDVKLDKSPEEFSNLEKEHILNSSLDSDALDNFESFSEVARSEAESLDSDLNSQSTKTLVDKAQTDVRPDEIDNESFRTFTKELYHQDQTNETSQKEKESNSLYDYNIKDVTQHGWEKVALLKTIADGITVSNISFAKDLFSELKGDIIKPDFYTNDDKITKVYNALTGIIKFPNDDRSLISNSMKMIGLGEIEAKRIFGVSHSLKETFTSSNLDYKKNRAYYSGILNVINSKIRDLIEEETLTKGDHVVLGLSRDISRLKRGLHKFTTEVDFGLIDEAIQAMSDTVGLSLSDADTKKQITFHARKTLARFNKKDLISIDKQHLDDFIDINNTLPARFSDSNKFKDAVRNSYNKIEYGVDTQAAVLEDSMLHFKEEIQSIQTMSSDDIFASTFDHLSYGHPLISDIEDSENRSGILASVRKVMSIYNSGYDQLLDSFGKNIDKDKYKIKGYHPQDLNLNQLRGLRKISPTKYTSVIDSMYKVLDIDKTKEIRDLETIKQATDKIKRISKDKKIASISVEDITKDGIIYKEHPIEYAPIEMYLKKRKYKRKFTKKIHRNIMGRVLNDLIYDSITDDVVSKNTKDQTMRVRVPMTDSHRVFYYKSFTDFLTFAKNYGLFSSPLDLFINKNRRNIRQTQTIHTYGDVNIHKNLLGEFPERHVNSKVSFIKSLVDKHTTWGTQNIINRLLSNTISDEMFSNPIWDVTTKSIKLTSDISNLGSVIFSIIPADTLNSMIQLSGIGIKARTVFGELIGNFIKNVDPEEANKILRSKNKATRFQLKESMRYTPEQKKAHPTAMKVDNTLTSISDAFFTYNLTNRWTQTSMYTIKKFILSNLFEEMKGGEFSGGKTWGRLQKYGLTKSIFDSLKELHKDVEDFHFDYLPRLKEGNALMGAVEYFSNEVIVHMSPYTKSIFSQMGSFGNLLLYTQFYLYGTTLQETVDKLLYPLFIYGQKNKYAMNVMGDLLSAMVTKSLKAVTSGKTPQLNNINFYRNLPEFMPSLSFFGNILSDKLSKNGTIKGGDNFGIYKSLWDALNFDVYSLYRDISPMKTTPFVRILNDRLILDNLYKGLHSSESYDRHIQSKKRYNEKEGTPFISFRGNE